MNWQGRSVLVTGARGFLGGWLCSALLDRGAEVVALVRDELAPSDFPQLESRLHLVRGNMEDDHLLERLVFHYEVKTVFHVGAQTLVGRAARLPVNTFESNIRGSWLLLEACRQAKTVEQIVVASSDKAYGSQKEGLYTEESRLDATFPYDVSKACTDMICQCYAKTYGLPVVVTRCGNFFGGGDLNWSRLIPGTLRAIMQHDQGPVIRSDGSYVRDYLYIEDAVAAYIHLAESLATRPDLAGEAFNFSFERPLTVLEFVNLMLTAVGRLDLQPKVLNLPEARLEIPVQMLSAEKARQQLNWQPRFGLDEGLARTIDWYRNYFERQVKP